MNSLVISSLNKQHGFYAVSRLKRGILNGHLLFELSRLAVPYLSCAIRLSDVEFLCRHRHHCVPSESGHNRNDDVSYALEDTRQLRTHVNIQDTRNIPIVIVQNNLSDLPDDNWNSVRRAFSVEFRSSFVVSSILFFLLHSYVLIR